MLLTPDAVFFPPHYSLLYVFSLTPKALHDLYHYHTQPQLWLCLLLFPHSSNTFFYSSSLNIQGCFRLSKRDARHNFFSILGRTNDLRSLPREPLSWTSIRLFISIKNASNCFHIHQTIYHETACGIPHPGTSVKKMEEMSMRASGCWVSPQESSSWRSSSFLPHEERNQWGCTQEEGNR